MRVPILAAALALGCTPAPTPLPNGNAGKLQATSATAKKSAATARETGLAATVDTPDLGGPRRVAATSPPPRCAIPQNAESLALVRSVPARTPTGLELRFDGISHDDYADGQFDVVATLHFRYGGQSSQRLPSTLAAHAPDEVLGHCFQLVSANQRTAQVRVAPLGPRDPRVGHLGGGRCEPMPQEHSPCTVSEGFCVLSWGKPGGYSSALFCRDGRWVIENERNLP